MATRERHRSPVYRQLEAYRESWRKDHEDAMACRDWEDAIAVGVNVCRMLQEREQAWRDQVFRGAIPFAGEDDADYRERVALWLETTDEVLANVLPNLERRFGTVAGAEDLRRSAAQVRDTLARWEPPRLSAAVGLREMVLSHEAAAELDRLIDEARTKPPDSPSSPPMQEMPAAEFLRRKCAKPE